MDAYAIANQTGTVKHIAVWHRHAVGPSPLCNQTAARALIDPESGVDKTVLFERNPSTIDRPWCSRCELTVEAMVKATAVRIPEVSK